jgi:hypothetical protein|tara:strand:- start:158 stop:409 length:252 start_codon:yes stop_codon:yes gene_type:complete
MSRRCCCLLLHHALVLWVKGVRIVPLASNLRVRVRALSIRCADDGKESSTDAAPTSEPYIELNFASYNDGALAAAQTNPDLLP